jgi:heme exporter protein D
VTWNHIANLTPPERETVLLTSDADDHYDIWTAQRKVITKLKKNPAAELLEEGSYGTTVWARFKLPANLVSFRSVTRRQALTTEQKRARAERLKANRKATA